MMPLIHVPLRPAGMAGFTAAPPDAVSSQKSKAWFT